MTLHQRRTLKEIQNGVLQNEVNDPRWKVRNAAGMQSTGESRHMEEINRNVHCITIINVLGDLELKYSTGA